MVIHRGSRSIAVGAHARVLDIAGVAIEHAARMLEGTGLPGRTTGRELLVRDEHVDLLGVSVDDNPGRARARESAGVREWTKDWAGGAGGEKEDGPVAGANETDGSSLEGLGYDVSDSQR